jgi:hypothetical protein
VGGGGTTTGETIGVVEDVVRLIEVADEEVPGEVVAWLVTELSKAEEGGSIVVGMADGVEGSLTGALGGKTELDEDGTAGASLETMTGGMLLATIGSTTGVVPAFEEAGGGALDDTAPGTGSDEKLDPSPGEILVRSVGTTG